MRSILVHADGGEYCAVRLHFARELARRHQARLTALFAAAPPLLDMPYAYTAGAIELDHLHHAHAVQRAHAQARFESVRSDLPDQAVWTELEADQPVVPGFVRQAFHADLVVLGKDDPESLRQRGLPDDFATAVIMASGRPAIIVPRAWRPTAMPSTVLIAWKPSAQAARAVSGAMPLLRHARQVHVVSWGEPPQRVRGDGLDMPGQLALEGIAATVHRFDSEPSGLGDVLLAMAGDIGADLLVMGCYGHSRTREVVLGGASRTVLRSMTLPVLTSH